MASSRLLKKATVSERMNYEKLKAEISVFIASAFILVFSRLASEPF